jgi:hypothetical protein
MTGYFSRLLDRATGASPVLEPRRRSRFEPQPGMSVVQSPTSFEWYPEEPREAPFARRQPLLEPQPVNRVAPSSTPLAWQPGEPPEVRMAENSELPKIPLASSHPVRLEEANETSIRRELTPSARNTAPLASRPLPRLEHRESRATATPSAEAKPTDRTPFPIRKRPL